RAKRKKNTTTMMSKPRPFLRGLRAPSGALATASSLSKPKGSPNAEWAAATTGEAGWATAALALAALAGAATATFGVLFAFIWKVFLQCLQRIGFVSHAAGIRSTFVQCGHFA